MVNLSSSRLGMWLLAGSLCACHKSDEQPATYTVSTVAGQSVPGYTDGTGPNAQFRNPYGIAVDGSGNLYVADQSNSCIRLITNGKVVTVAGQANTGYVDGPVFMARFSSPTGVAVDTKGVIYVADTGNNCIRKIEPTGLVSTVVGSGNAGPGYLDGPVQTARLNAPSGVAVDAQGNLYIADKGNNRVRKLTPAGVVSTVLIAPGPAAFIQSSGVAVGADGSVYASDARNQSVYRLTAAGAASTVAGSAMAGYLDGESSKARFSSPTGVAVDAQGTVYVADTDNQVIRQISSAGQVSTYAGSHTNGYADGQSVSAQFSVPTGVAVDTQGQVYVADLGNARIRQISKSK